MRDDNDGSVWKKFTTFPNGYTITYSTKRAQADLRAVTDMQEEYFEALVEDSRYTDATEVINRIKGLK